MSKPASTSPPQPPQTTWQRWRRPIVIGVILLILNVVAYLLLTPNRVERLGTFGYVSSFVVATVSNATVVIPIPYLPIVVRLSQAFNVWGIITAAAVGSAVGESVAFFVGRSGQHAVADTRFYRWMQRQMHPLWRAALVLFGLAAPLNPVFDVAGLLAGAMGVPFWLFFLAVSLGRMVRMGLAVLIGFGIENV